MANQKEYTIIINGIDKSVNEIDALIKQIDKLEKRLDALGKKEIKISTPKVTTPTSNGAAPKVDNTLEKEALKNAKLQTEEYKAQLVEIEKLKQANKDLTKIQKQIASGIRDANGEYSNTLAGQRAYLSELKEQLASMDFNDEGWDNLRNKVKQVNDNVQELETSFGVFGRNVGNYKSAADGFKNISVNAAEANKEVNKLDGSAEKLTHTVDDLRNDQRLIVNVKGIDVEFDNISQAVSELDDIVQGLAFKLQQLRDAGKENTDEFKKLNAEFQELNQQAASMERARKFSDELKDSLASSTRGLDLAVQGFQALTASMEIASGVAGLFGQDQEEIQEAMNRTVQLMGIAQGVQELYNQTLQKGTFLATANAKANKLAASIIPRFAKGTKAATVATKGLGLALKGLGIGIVISLVTTLMKYWDKVSEKFTESFPIINKLGDYFEKFEQILFGVGNVIFQWLVNPLKIAFDVISNVIQGNFKEAAEAARKGLKDQLKIVENYEKGANFIKEAQEENRLKIEKEALAESLKYQIDTLEAKKGNDAKYSAEGQKLYQQYFDTLLSMYAKDSDEYKQAVLDKLMYDRELKEHSEKNIENVKKENDKKIKAHEDYIKKLKEADKEIADNELASMKESFAKKKLELERQRIEEVKLATERGVKVGEVVNSINKKYNKLQLDLVVEHGKQVESALKSINDKIIQYNNQTFIKNIDVSNMFFQRNLDNILKSLNEFYAKLNVSKDFKLPSMNEIIGNTKGLSEEILKATRLFGDPQGTVLDSTTQTFDRLNEIYEKEKEFIKNENIQLSNMIDLTLGDSGKEQKKTLDELSKYLTSSLDDSLAQVATFKEKYSNELALLPTFNLLANNLQKEAALHQQELEENKRWYDENIELINKYLEEGVYTKEQWNKKGEELLEAYQSKETIINGDHYTKVNEITANGLKARNEVIKAYNKSAYENYSNMFDKTMSELENFNNSQSLDLGSMELNFFADFSQNILSINKFKKDVEDNFKAIQKERDELAKKFKDGIIDEETFNQSDKELLNLQKNVKGVLDGMEKDWKDWSKNIAELTAAGISIFSQMFGQIAEMQYQNEMKRIEKEREILDEEYEMLEENLQKQEELYDEHNDHVQGIEDELANARGDRREFLLGKIDEEMKKREEAWNQEQKIERQKKINERKKEQLEKQQEAAEKKRNKRQKAIQILQATASTALAVTNALSLQPFPLGLAMSVLAGALGAAQIAVIAKTKYANGGLLQGKSHAEGGIPVGNTGIEVEGNEYIINKQTTRANLPLVEMINSKKRKLNVNDFIEFYNKPAKIQTPSSNGKYENGGQIPSIGFNPRQIAQQVQNDNRPIFVSVTEIERVSNHLRNVKAVAGLEDND